VIINNLHIAGIASLPFKANTPAIIDPNTVLPGPIARQFFQVIRGRDAQILQGHSATEHPQLAQSDLLNVLRQLLGALAVEDFLSFSGLE
jgi:hypothetical protein